MAAVSLFILLALFHPAFSFPCRSFPCGELGEIFFPFTNNETDERCGPFVVDGCNEEIKKVQLGRGSQKWYQIESIFRDPFHYPHWSEISITDIELQSKLNSRKCSPRKALGRICHCREGAISSLGSPSSVTMHLKKLLIALLQKMNLEMEVLELYTMANFKMGGKLLSSVYMSATTARTRHRHEINLAKLAINKIQISALDELIDPCLGYHSDEEVKRMTTCVAELAFLCLQEDSELRPTMDEVLEELKRIESREMIQRIQRNSLIMPKN
ncbi:hypothetical protein GH714_041115 [Hevea brasiliensis]|uniref:Wall-associated receptor kinase galacturonan-binding domain-containing protein n=1 Tax=Hevea brasiliensis TaxID=3981 RepID=A0A6A6MVI8_HEVBR|nr:hypothetical protein GH714_041115 [Hevea brasiliensis]